MTFQEFTSLHPELADDARSLSFTSYMQGMEDARQIDTHGTIQPILANIATELSNAEEKWPEWPENYFQQACIVAEECGEAVRAVNEYHNDPTPDKYEDIINELIQTAAMCVRMIKYL